MHVMESLRLHLHLLFSVRLCIQAGAFSIGGKSFTRSIPTSREKRPPQLACIARSAPIEGYW